MPTKQIRAGRATVKPDRKHATKVRAILSALDRSLPDFQGEPLEKPILTTVDRISLNRGLITGEFVAINRNLLRSVIAALEPK